MEARWLWLVIILAVVLPITDAINCTCESYRGSCRSAKFCTGFGCYAAWHGKVGKLERGCLAEVEFQEYCISIDGYYCCRHAPMCADTYLLPTEPTIASTKKGSGNDSMIVVAIVCTVLVGVIFILIFGYLLKRRIWKAENLNKDPPDVTEKRRPRPPSDYEDSDMGEIFLMKRTIAKQLTWVEAIGYGRFGQVWHCTYQGMDVAVKTCTTKDENSWKKESFIYQTTMLRHDNVLGFRAADIYDYEGTTRMLLITDYHPRGSLFTVLQDTVLSISQGVSLASSAACGLNHLHSVIYGTRTKPAIAHRDLKSKNVLVKENGEACLCDLGLAVLYNPDVDNKEKFEVHNTRVGTKRYMAPEVLTEEISHYRFESFKMADIYSFGLLLWEILSRCQLYDGEDVLDYHEPYYNMVPADPTFDQMVEVVVRQERRPIVQDNWHKHPVACEMVTSMTSCWKKVPQSRFSALRLWKNLSGLNEQSFTSATSNSTACTNVSALSNSAGPMDSVLMFGRYCGESTVTSMQTSL